MTNKNSMAKEKVVMVHVEGGVVQEVTSNVKGLKCRIFDVDDLRAEGKSASYRERKYAAIRRDYKLVPAAELYR